MLADGSRLGWWAGSSDIILGPPKDHSNKVWFQLAKQFQRTRFLYIFPIGSYVKTMSADSAVLVGRQRGPPNDHHRIKF